LSVPADTPAARADRVCVADDLACALWPPSGGWPAINPHTDRLGTLIVDPEVRTLVFRPREAVR